jgi:hypothetical protein
LLLKEEGISIFLVKFSKLGEWMIKEKKPISNCPQQ